MVTGTNGGRSMVQRKDKKVNKMTNDSERTDKQAGFRSRSRTEPGNLAGAGAGAVNLARLHLLERILDNS